MSQQLARTSSILSEHKSEINVKDFSSVERDEDGDAFSVVSTCCTCNSSTNVSYKIEINSIVCSTDTHTTDCLANDTVNIGSIGVQNASDITIGSKTVFNAPVMIKELVVNYGEQATDEDQPQTKSTPTLRRRLRLRHPFRDPMLKCIFLIAFAVIVTDVIVILYFFNVLNAQHCSEEESIPTHFECGFGTACSRCQALYPKKKVCLASHRPDCYDLLCYCKPGCRLSDCEE